MTSSTIEIFVRPVERTFTLAQHIYIVGTDSQGNKKILRAGPETNKGASMLTDNLKAVYLPYIDENKELFKGDFEPENVIKIYTITGTDSEIQAKMEKMWEVGKQINAGNDDYKLALSVIGCPESICHVQNSNTVGYLMVKSIGVDLKPILEEKKLWAPGIDGDFVHTLMDKVTHNYIDGLAIILDVLEDKAQNPEMGIGAIIMQTVEKLEQFRAHQGEYSSAEEYAKFAELMQDLDLNFVLDKGKAYKYTTHSYTFHKNYYCNTITECFNDFMPEYRNHLFSKNVIKSYEWVVQSADEFRLKYKLQTVHLNDRYYEFDELFDVEKNMYYDPNYMSLIRKQCNSLSEFRDSSSPLDAKLNEICSFVGVNNDNSKGEL